MTRLSLFMVRCTQKYITNDLFLSVPSGRMLQQLRLLHVNNVHLFLIIFNVMLNTFLLRVVFMLDIFIYVNISHGGLLMGIDLRLIAHQVSTLTLGYQDTQILMHARNILQLFDPFMAISHLDFIHKFQRKTSVLNNLIPIDVKSLL